MFVASILTLGACGGSGSGGDADVFRMNAISDINAFEAIDSSGTPVTALAAETGSVAYTGLASFEAGTEGPITDVTDYAAVGSFEAIVDFGSAQSITGTADSFYEISNPEIFDDGDVDFNDVTLGEQIAGSFTFDLDIVDTFGFAGINGTINGSLTTTDDTSYIYTDIGAGGEFYGDNLDAFGAGGFIQEGDTYSEINVFGLR